MINDLTSESCAILANRASLMMISPVAVLCPTRCRSILILQAINPPYRAEAGIPSAAFGLEPDQNSPHRDQCDNDFQEKNIVSTMYQLVFV